MKKMVGRKIKRGHGLYGNRKKKRTKGILAIILTVVAAGALVFLGYSIGGPVMNFFKNLGENSGATNPWTPPVSESETNGTESVSSGTEAPIPSVVQGSAVLLRDEALKSSDALKKAVETAKADGYTTVIVPMKLQGGEMNYRSTIEMAVKSGVSSEDGMTASEIASLIKESGVKSIAHVSVLYDNIVPKTFKTAGYSFEDGSTQWLDNRPDNGGKPWLSPFSAKGREYVSAVAEEINTAGFDCVLCADVSFPAFRKNDLKYIGDSVKDENRYKSLITVLKLFPVGDTSVMVEVSAEGVLAGTEEIFHPEELSGITAVMLCKPVEWKDSITVDGEAVSLDDMGMAQKTAVVFGKVKDMTGNLDVVPYIDGNGLSDGELSDVLRALDSIGYKSVAVK